MGLLYVFVGFELVQVVFMDLLVRLDGVLGGRVIFGQPRAFWKVAYFVGVKSSSQK